MQPSSLGFMTKTIKQNVLFPSVVFLVLVCKQNLLNEILNRNLKFIILILYFLWRNHGADSWVLMKGNKEINKLRQCL